MTLIKKALPYLLLICLAFTVKGQLPDTVARLYDLTVIRLSPHAYMYTSTNEFSLGDNAPVNGVIIVVKGTAVLVDAPWDDTHTRVLMNYIFDSLHAVLQIAVITHAQNNRIGGIGELKRAFIPVYALEATTILAKEDEFPRPDIIFDDSLSLNFSGQNLMFYYPGAGQNSDNLLVWLPADKFLFGGGFIIDASIMLLGNTNDVDAKIWRTSLMRVMRRFKDAAIIVPGHGKSGGHELFQHTLDLLNNYLKPDK